MSRISKKKLIKVLKGDFEQPTMSKAQIFDMFRKPITQEEWLKGYNEWKKKQLAND
jgi:hypothetical protein